MSNNDASQSSVLRPQSFPIVRRAVEADAPEVARVVARAFKDKFNPAFGTEEKAIRALTPYIAAEMTRRGNHVFVATVGEVVVGSVSVSTQKSFVSGVAGMFYHAVGFWGTVRALLVLGFLSDPAPAPDEAYVEVLGVAPEYQRQGVGRALMIAAEEMARSLHKRRLTLYVTSNNRAAQTLYRSRGLNVQRQMRSLVGWLLFHAPGFWRMEKVLR
ncbi:MAG: GNAT family N-acetyltransferase [Thermomicrobia bacterium]|nr:GNAT family N-acetyltransferase [Thermomicrobia bacterium]